MLMSSMVFSIRSEACANQSALKARRVDGDCIFLSLVVDGEAPRADWAGEWERTGDRLGIGVG